MDEKRAAGERLMTLRQSKSVDAYASEFRQMAARTKWNDAALTAWFYQGLKDGIKDDMARTDRPRNL